METDRLDHLSLLAADAERCLDGLSHSLGRGPQGMAQGALHSRDLSRALHSLGLVPMGDLVDGVARQLTLGQPSVLEVALGLVPLIEKAVRDIQLGRVQDADLAHDEWAPWAARLDEVVQRDRAVLTEFQAVVPRVDAASVDAGLAVPAREQPASAERVATPDDPGALALRRAGLNLIQQARIANQRDDERTVRQIDVLLSELQDWSLRVGQVPLSSLYDRPEHEVRDVWLDEGLRDRLAELQPFARRCRRIQAQSRSLTLYIEWIGVEMSDAEAEVVGECLRQMQGKLRKVTGGYGLVMPSSLGRMRVTPFVLKGQRYAVAWAQFVQYQEPAGEGRGRLILSAGQTSRSIGVDAVLPSENMNIFPVPPQIVRPAWLTGVAIDGGGETYLCVSPG